MNDRSDLSATQVVVSAARTNDDMGVSVTAESDTETGNDTTPAVAADNRPQRLEKRAFARFQRWNLEMLQILDALAVKRGDSAWLRFDRAFSFAYCEQFSNQQALADVLVMDSLTEQESVAIRFDANRRVEAGQPLSFRLYSGGQPPALSDIIPVLENLGLRVLTEHPYRIETRRQQVYWVSEVRVELPRLPDNADLDGLWQHLQTLFAQVWYGAAENDRFNRLTLVAGLDWRQITLLRACARYIKQIRFGFSQSYLADVLFRHPQITRSLVQFFHARFEPQSVLIENEVRQSLERLLEAVPSIDEDRILRRFLQVMAAITRTNAWRVDNHGLLRDFWSFKIRCADLPDLPRPRPVYEIFVYSPWVEGVHLRAGKVARGGLRWSDRPEDYRTEVLGLVKAQQVKNSVIVPMGAKGCFVCKQLPPGTGPNAVSRDVIQAEAVRCYQTFIRGLLDLTDNLQDGQVQHPPMTRRHDDDDIYLVVAADKGTASFSDIANRIAAEYDFWLGDAFASGGSQGYDHKAMGITARGAWESVRRHFREQGRHAEQDSLSLVAIGDMSGDVFGNGLLLSSRLRLLAAFNHQHIFIDPEPDPVTAFAERQRLFALPRSSWADYQPQVISEGGGVFSRQARWIPISAAMQRRFGISASRLAPNELIRLLLGAEVDLIWNGGIGTYVKASQETHASVGDKSNDAVRINASDLRCKVLGEGGNLGFTQRARIEFSLRGGACYTDFIDNAGGVDCSDHEVNIKILLNDLVKQALLSPEQRNQLLRDMTGEVARQVLASNYRQAQALEIAVGHCRDHADEYPAYQKFLQQKGLLDPALEYLPDDAALASRRDTGTTLTRPELAVLLSYAKIELKQALVCSPVTAHPAFAGAASASLPVCLQQAYPQALQQHRLSREMAATWIANDLVNRAGMTFVWRLRNLCGHEPGEIAAAWLVAGRIFDLDRHWQAIEALDYRVAASVQIAMMRALMQLMERATLWLLRYASTVAALASDRSSYQTAIRQLVRSPQALAQVIPDSRWRPAFEQWLIAGVPEEVALFCAAAESLYWMLDILDISHAGNGTAGISADAAAGHGLETVARTYFALGSALELTWLDEQLRKVNGGGRWQTLAIKGYRRELDARLREITLDVLLDSSEDSQTGVERWLGRQGVTLARWRQTLADLQAAGHGDCALFSVAIGVLGEFCNPPALVS